MGQAHLVGLDAFGDVKRAVVVVAHADDMETMMGGTVWLLAQRGVEFYELICTRGDLGAQDNKLTRGELSAIRRSEAEEAGRILGLKAVVTLDHHDGELEPTLELRAAIAGYYRLWQPDTLFTFDPSWLGQVHPDHRAAGRAALDAFMPSKMPLYRPEQLEKGAVANITRAFLLGPSEPAIFVDVSEVYDVKIRASMAHVSQFPKGDESLKWLRDLDAEAAQRAGKPGSLCEQFAALRVW